MAAMLTRDEIVDLVQKKGVISPFLEDGLNPASYDVHIGRWFFEATQPGREGAYFNLADWPRKTYPLEPGSTAVLVSLEQVRMPEDVQGLLVLRASWATQGLYYAGGLVKPGYWGYLFFSVTNLSLHTIDLPMEAPLASLALFRLPEAVGTAPWRIYQRTSNPNRPTMMYIHFLNFP